MKPALLATIVCPQCHQEVEATREACPACRAPLSDSKNSESLRVIDRPWFIVVLLLHVGFLGIPIFWRANYSVAIRLGICLASIAYTVFAVAVIGGVGLWLYRML